MRPTRGLEWGASRQTITGTLEDGDIEGILINNGASRVSSLVPGFGLSDVKAVADL